MTGSPPPAPLVPGSTVGHYAVVSTLGRGGMGEVFLARDTRLDRKVALKVLSREFVGDGDHLQRFQREARNLANLSHPNIVTIFAVEEVEGQHLLSMEYVEGQTLRHVEQAGRVPLERFLDIAVALSDAVGAAHERGVTHRDLKPENVMVTDSGRVKVLDFGLAKALPNPEALVSSGDPETMTREGLVLGTLPYMSPEQAEGRQVDHRSDIFSLGVIFYEMLAGVRPFTGETSARILSSILRDTPLPVTAHQSDLPVELARIVRMCLQKDPGQRYHSALDLRNHLQDLVDEIRWKRLDSDARRVESRRARGSRPLSVSLETRTGITALLAAVLAINWVETSIETTLKTEFGLGNERGYELAAVMSWLERGLSFERHDLTNPAGIYTASIAYFFVPLVLLGATIVTLSRNHLPAYRTFALAIATTYVLSLGCYLFFPVPERWAYPDSEAVLLSDLWSVKLIQAIRPISGLDNCFPSFHVSSAVTILLVWYVYRLRCRHAVAFLSLAVVLSTFLLGIHWLADIVAGIAVGIVSVYVALRVNRALSLASDPELTTREAQAAGSELG
jgi:serine/threonine protein kinase